MSPLGCCGCVQLDVPSFLHQVAVQVKPVYAPPHLFPIGRETITYIATDRSGNQANCSFTITVVGESVLSSSSRGGGVRSFTLNRFNTCHTLDNP